MTTPTLIKTLFANDIQRRIEEVIKVDQTDEEIIRDEIDEYVVTDAIRSHYTTIFDAYSETPNKPHEGIAVWISGFFGSGKSSFAKMLGLSIANRLVAGEPAAERFAERAGDKKLQVLLKAINEKIPTHAVIFDVSTDRGIRSGNQTLTEIMYGLFLQSLGYAKDLDLSELEIGLEEKVQLSRFEEEYKRLFEKDWSVEKGKVAFALSEASRVLHSLDPETYPMADSWVKAVKNKADITPGKLAERAGELMKRRQPGRSLMFVVDEVGQFVARDVQKMLDLQAVVQSLGVKGRGKHWVVVTSQEKLGELVSGLDDKKIELARLMDRFPLQVHLEPSDISEVTSRRVLSKNAAAESALGTLFDEHRGRLIEHTRLTADIKLPELSRESFIDLYPLLPYQIDLIIQVVSGLRTQGGTSKHVGGANRTIIKLAQQLLINPAVNLADGQLGDLVRLDQVYDLVEGNIGSEVRAKIAAIVKELDHPLAQPVAKVKVLFDRRDPSSVLWPKRATFEQLLEILNAGELAKVWGEDETIGWVYQFFNSQEERRKMREESQAPRNSRELAVRNQFFTPRYVVQFLTDNTLGRIWYEMRSTKTVLAGRCEYMVRKLGEEFAPRGKKDPRDLRALDPACGSGHFLLYAFDLLLSIYEEAHADAESPKSDATGRTLAEDYPSIDMLRKAVPSLILAHNLHGVDIDPRCTQIAQLALWMRAQKAYGDFGIGRAERRQIRRSNIVVAEPLIADEQIAKEFVAKLVDAELGRMFTGLVETLNLAGDMGLLLRVETLVAPQSKIGQTSDLFAAPEERIRAALARFVSDEGDRANTRRRLFADDAAHGVALLGIVEMKFDVILMNPPFGAGSTRAKKDFERAYPRTKNDIYAAFVERGIELLSVRGRLGAITSRTGFFLTSFKRWREEILLMKAPPAVLADLGVGVLDSAMVETAAYCLEARE